MSYSAAAGTWSNPPPPGTCQQDSEASSSASHEDRTISKHRKEHKSKISKHNKRRRSRSRSRSHHRRRHYRSSRSSSVEKSKYSSSKRTHRRRYSRSRSRSRSRKRHYKHKRSHSRRKSRSRSYSRSWSRERRHRKSHSRSNSNSRSPMKDSVSDNDESGPSQENTFKNDGSFLEMFKKLQEQQQQLAAETKPANDAAAEIINKPSLPAFGKRRGGRVLKTGLVQKLKAAANVEEDEPKDAWSIYMKEVKRYKEACCDDDSKTRPLVK